MKTVVKGLLIFYLFFNMLIFPSGALAETQVSTTKIDLPTYNAPAGDGSSISLDVRKVDLRDVLSALAIKMGVNIILTDATPIEISFKANNISPKLAMELIVQKQGMAYLQEGNIILVGKPDTLHKDFFNQEMLTRFDTYYIKSDKLQKMINEIDIQGVKSVIVDTNPNILWAQGTVEALQKVRELLSQVDVPEVAPAVEQSYEENYSRFVYQLNYIVAADAADRLSKFGFENVKTIATDGDRYGHELMVICPKKIETQVKSVLGSLDSPRKNTRAPILTAKGTGAANSLAAARDLLSQVGDVSVANMTISSNLGTSDNPIYVLWCAEAPDKIRVLKDLVKEMRLEEISSDSNSSTSSSTTSK